MVGATVACRPASPPLRVAREVKIARALRKGERAGRFAWPPYCDGVRAATKEQHTNSKENEYMAESHRERRYFGMTAAQVGILSLLAVMNCVILSVGAVLVLTPQSPSSVAIANQQQPTPPATFAWPPTATPQPTTALRTTPISIATPMPTVGPAQIAQLDTLDSYRLQGKVVMEGGLFGSTSVGWNFTQEWVKKSQAQRTITLIDVTTPMSSTSVPRQNPQVAMEAIVIGNTYWLKVGNDWMQVDSRQPQYQRTSVGNLQSDWPSIKPAGEETVSNIRCKHYTVDEDTMKMSGPNGVIMVTHAQGDIWVANQPNLPSVIMRARIRMRVSGSFFSPLTASPVPSPEAQEPKEMVYYYEYEITDVNIPITIEPPKMSHGQ